MILITSVHKSPVRAKMFLMARIKDKHIRLPASSVPILEEVREKMGRKTHIAGMAINPAIKLGDGLVISWALAMANHLMNPKFSVINREDFAAKFEAALGPMLPSLLLLTDDERREAIALLVAAASKLGGYNEAEGLRATPPEGGGSAS